MKVAYAAAGVLAVVAVGYIIYKKTEKKRYVGTRESPLPSNVAQDYLFAEVLRRANAPRNT